MTPFTSKRGHFFRRSPAWAPVAIAAIALGMPLQPAHGQRSGAYQAQNGDDVEALAGIVAEPEWAVQDILGRIMPPDADSIDRYQFEVNLRLADTRTLYQISKTTTYEDAAKILFPSVTKAVDAGGPPVQNAIGDLDTDYAYTAVTPCRIVDTRPSSGGSGTILGQSTRDFFVYGDGPTIGGQGGNSSGCASPRGEPRAVHINATVVPSTTGQGHLRVYPANITPPPLVSLVNYEDGTIVANAGIIQTQYAIGPPELRVYASSNIQVVIDVLGYFHEVSAISLNPPSIQGTLFTCLQDTTTMVVTVDTSFENQTPFCFSSENENDMRAVFVSHLWRAGSIVPGTYEIGICGAQGNVLVCGDGLIAQPFYLSGPKVLAVVSDAVGDSMIYHSGYDLAVAPSVDTMVPQDHFLSGGDGSTVVTISAGDTVLVQASGQIHGDRFSSSP